MVDYASFQPLPQIYPATSDKLKAFGVAVDSSAAYGMNRKTFHRRTVIHPGLNCSKSPKLLIRQWSQLPLHEALPTYFSFLG